MLNSNQPFSASATSGGSGFMSHTSTSSTSVYLRDRATAETPSKFQSLHNLSTSSPLGRAVFECGRHVYSPVSFVAGRRRVVLRRSRPVVPVSLVSKPSRSRVELRALSEEVNAFYPHDPVDLEDSFFSTPLPRSAILRSMSRVKLRAFAKEVNALYPHDPVDLDDSDIFPSSPSFSLLNSSFAYADPFLSVIREVPQDSELISDRILSATNSEEIPMPPPSPLPFVSLSLRDQAALRGDFFPDSESSGLEVEEFFQSIPTSPPSSFFQCDSSSSNLVLCARSQVTSLDISAPPSESSDASEEDLSSFSFIPVIFKHRHPLADHLKEVIKDLERGQLPQLRARQAAGSETSFSGTEYSLESDEPCSEFSHSSDLVSVLSPCMKFSLPDEVHVRCARRVTKSETSFDGTEYSLQSVSEMSEVSHSSDLVPVLSPCFKFDLPPFFPFPPSPLFTDGPICHLPLEDCLHCYGQVENSHSVLSDSTLSDVLAVDLTDPFLSSPTPLTADRTLAFEQSACRQMPLPPFTTEIGDISVDEIFDFALATDDTTEIDIDDDNTTPKIPGAWPEEEVEEKNVARSWASRLMVGAALAASATLAGWALASWL